MQRFTDFYQYFRIYVFIFTELRQSPGGDAGFGAQRASQQRGQGRGLLRLEGYARRPGSHLQLP